MNFYQKKIALTTLLLVVIAIIFWTGSRYPQLDTKAMMGADSPTMGISFDIVKQVESDHSTLEKIAYNTLNWVDTNKKGMTFGFLFGAGFILLFSLLKDVSIKNRFLNTAFGAIVGAPLGVCVNCAAPIAKGMKDAGAKTETALATMITSPTLNVIVLSMLFSFLPAYMVWLKIGLTLLFIFGVIPLISPLFKDKKETLAAPKPNKVPVFHLESPDSDKLFSSSWQKAMLWMLQSYAKSLWFIIKTTLPLMLLAGLLGNVLITFLPLEELIGLVKNLSISEKVAYMLGIAFVATFLPVPIAFDVIITAILWSTGLHSRFAMVLLFCLGTYSIYSSFIVAQSFSVKLSVLLFLTTVAFGFVAGVSGHFLEREFGRNYRLQQYEQLKQSDSQPQRLFFINKEQHGKTYAELQSLIKPLGNQGKVHHSDELEVLKTPFQPKQTNGKAQFNKLEGGKLGLHVPYHFTVEQIHDPLANQRSIASGDVHQDGYPDLLVVSSGNLFLYANMNGKRFERQHFPSYQAKTVYNAALVDFNNDGWKDVFFSTYRNGNYILKNDSGNFDQANLIRLPQLEGMVLTVAPAFGDMNQDGWMDILLGNWTIGVMGGSSFSLESSKNSWLEGKGDFQFELKALDGIDGETLTTLIADYTNDGRPDVAIGNDFNVPDHYYTSTAEKNDLKWIKQADNLVEHSTFTTMSITSADINNDLIPEIFQAQIDRLNADNSTNDIETICSGIKDKVERENCEEILTLQQQMIHAVTTRNYEQCPDEFRNDCIAGELIRSVNKGELIENWCDYFSDGWENYQFICEINEGKKTPYPLAREGSYELKRRGGVLLMKDSTGLFKDQTAQYGLAKTGWAWNSKFADVDNDGWQDLLIANGFLLHAPQEPNLFYRNINGTYFEEQTDRVGLSNYLPTSSYTYVDFDLDGDLDIIMTPSIGPVFIYENNFHSNHSIAFSIQDEKGNRDGVGTVLSIYYGDGLRQTREVMLSGGYKSFDETIAHFGLGEETSIQQLKIEWNDGEETIITEDFMAGGKYQIHRFEN